MISETAKLYYSIGEVAAQFNVNESLLRFWEKEFETIKPKKNSKGTRIYTKEDIEAIKQVFYLVKKRKMTLSGAKKQLANKRKTVSVEMEALEHLERVKQTILEIKASLSDLNVDEHDTEV
jgi:DNA-binding transcriptional MerR regulator